MAPVVYYIYYYEPIASTVYVQKSSIYKTRIDEALKSNVKTPHFGAIGLCLRLYRGLSKWAQKVEDSFGAIAEEGFIRVEKFYPSYIPPEAKGRSGEGK